jgi:hypothetical protein
MLNRFRAASNAGARRVAARRFGGLFAVEKILV